MARSLGSVLASSADLFAGFDSLPTGHSSFDDVSHMQTRLPGARAGSKAFATKMSHRGHSRVGLLGGTLADLCPSVSIRP